MKISKDAVLEILREELEQYSTILKDAKETGDFELADMALANAHAISLAKFRIQQMKETDNAV
jgi:hypothetical protein